MTRWSTFLFDTAALEQMDEIPVSIVVRHGEGVLNHRPTTRDLYERWDRQQWSASEIRLSRDAEQWCRMRGLGRERLALLLRMFLVGEYTGLDLLGPISTGCPDEESLLFLGTQVADETRHLWLMSTIATELLGASQDLGQALPETWDTLAPATQALHLLEGELARELTDHIGSYEHWLRAVAVFHLVTEGVLALCGQRRILYALRKNRLLTGVKASFVAMARDESRHVGFGMNALRRGIQEGYEDDICDVLGKVLPLALQTDLPKGADALQTAEAIKTASTIVEIARVRLSQIGLSPGLAAGLIKAAERDLTEALSLD